MNLEDLSKAEELSNKWSYEMLQYALESYKRRYKHPLDNVINFLKAAIMLKEEKMGYFINPQDGTTKEKWLMEHGTIALPTEKRPDGYHFVCLVDNGAFTAAGIAYCDAELQAFSRPDDPRPKAWFLVKDELLIQVNPDVDGRLR